MAQPEMIGTCKVSKYARMVIPSPPGARLRSLLTWAEVTLSGWTIKVSKSLQSKPPHAVEGKVGESISWLKSM